jgi:hypothetical protein
VKKPFLFLAFLFFTTLSFAQPQKISPADLKILRKKEDSLKVLVKNIFIDTLTAGRMRSDSQFIRTLVRSLQVKNSFYYPFDSVRGISKLFAPDSSFKIFTWQIDFDGFYIRQRGAIQYRTPDGSLKLVALRDCSEFTDNAMDSVRGKDNWIGAVYYGITQTKFNGKNYYTLFGFDEYGIRSNKKWMEVLTFDDRNMPVFGGQYFSFAKDSIRRKDQYRYNIEYKKEAATTVNFDPEMGMILFDHLISESDEPDNPWTLIPDGDYEGFKWTNGKWVHIDKVFTEKADMKGVDPFLGNPPVGDPLLDKDGNHDEKKLKEKTDKNKAKKSGGGEE